jgi:hypothetical protein
LIVKKRFFNCQPPFLVLTIAFIFVSSLCWAAATPAAKDVAKAKIPKTLYCTTLTDENRYSVDLRPLASALGEPAETLDLALFRNAHLVTPLGKIGGGQKLNEFIILILPPADADAFSSTRAPAYERQDVSQQQPSPYARTRTCCGASSPDPSVPSTKTGHGFELRILDAAGELLKKNKLTLILQ